MILRFGSVIALASNLSPFSRFCHSAFVHRTYIRFPRTTPQRICMEFSWKCSVHGSKHPTARIPALFGYIHQTRQEFMFNQPIQRISLCFLFVAFLPIFFSFSLFNVFIVHVHIVHIMSMMSHQISHTLSTRSNILPSPHHFSNDFQSIRFSSRICFN